MTQPDWDETDWDALQDLGRVPSGSDVPTDWEWHYPLTDEEHGEPVRRVWANVLNGKIPLEALDEQELIHMRLRDKNGVLHKGGGGPTRLPRDLRRARSRLLEELMQDSDLDFALKAQKIRQDIAEDDTLDAAVRLRAATYGEERARGKVPERVEMAVAIAPWEGLVSEILVDVRDDQGSVPELD